MQSVVHQYLTSVRPMHERFVEPARETADLVLGWQHTPQEWAQLMTALGVLKDTARAREMWALAQTALASDPAGLEQVRAAAATAGVTP